MTELNRRVQALYEACQEAGGCVPGRRTVTRMVMVKQKKGNTVEDYRELRVCKRCSVPINPWSGRRSKG